MCVCDGGVEGQMNGQWLQIEWLRLQSAAKGVPLSVCVTKVKSKHSAPLHLRIVGTPGHKRDT